MYNVLIVEDDPMVAMINEQFVSRHKDFTVVEKCGDGESALEFLEENKVDLVIMDVYMPVMDGFETLRQIRKRQIEVDVIMVTAANETESLKQGLHLGVVDYLVKPFTFERFKMALDKYLAQVDALKDLEKVNQKNASPAQKGGGDRIVSGIRRFGVVGEIAPERSDEIQD